MTRTLNLNATVAFPAGEIALRIDGAQLDAKALGSIQETLGLMLELAVNVDEPAPAEPAAAPAPEPAAAPAKAPAKKRSAPKASAAPKGGSRIALLRRIDTEGGTFEGSLGDLARATPTAGGTDGARKQAAAQLAKTDLVHVTRDGRLVTSITLSAAGRALLAGGAGTNAEPARPRSTPAPQATGRRPLPKAVDDPDDGTDLDWAADALTVS